MDASGDRTRDAMQARGATGVPTPRPQPPLEAVCSRRKARGPRGVTVPRHFSTEGVDPFESVEWERRTASINGEKGEAIFEQADCEIPLDWSQLATNVVVSKYFRGNLNTSERESSVKQLIGRVVGRIHMISLTCLTVQSW